MKNNKIQRKENTRTLRVVKDERPLLLFSFKDFDLNQGQSFEQWEKESILADLQKIIKEITSKTYDEAVKDNLIKTYQHFPKNSKFKHPKYIFSEANWGVIMKLGHQKRRAVFHMIENVLYLVFLDKDHEFFPSEK